MAMACHGHGEMRMALTAWRSPARPLMPALALGDSSHATPMPDLAELHWYVWCPWNVYQYVYHSVYPINSLERGNTKGRWSRSGKKTSLCKNWLRNHLSVKTAVHLKKSVRKGFCAEKQCSVKTVLGKVSACKKNWCVFFLCSLCVQFFLGVYFFLCQENV